MSYSTWHSDFFKLPVGDDGFSVFYDGSFHFEQTKQRRIASVSRTPGSLDLFAIGWDNKVWSTYWSEASGWSRKWFPLPGNAVFDREKQQVAVVSRGPGNLDLFVIGFDNRVWSTYWNDATGWAPDWFPLPGVAGFDKDNQHVAAVSRAQGNLDLFVIGFDNRVWSTYWSDASGWALDWFPLPGTAVFDREKQAVAAVSRSARNLDLFVIGFDNRVWSSYWNAENGWSSDWFPLPGSAVFDRERQRIAVVSRSLSNLDLFVVGFDNHVWSTFWSDASGWSSDWFLLPGNAVFDREKQHVAVVTRSEQNLDLFIIGFDNRVWSTFWNSSTGWAPDWFPLPGKARFDRDARNITAVSRTNGNLDLFVIGFDNNVWSSFWPSQVLFQGQIRSDGLDALGGNYTVTVFADGAVRWQGEVTNTGIDWYEYFVSAIVRPPSGRGICLNRQGTIPSRVPLLPRIRRTWDEFLPSNALLSEHYQELSNAEFLTHVSYNGGIADAFKTVSGWLLKFAVGSAMGPVGSAVVFLGVEAGSLISTGSLVPGARVLEGVLWMAGPYNTLYAIAAKGVSYLGSQSRHLYPEEYDWANEQVFSGKLPPRDKILLTDTIGGGDRPFTFPNVGYTTINMGPAAFADPRKCPGGKYGEVFIHELVHACQIAHSKMEISLIADALASRVCELTTGDRHAPYKYGVAGFNYLSLNLEQQAEIVSDWFAGNTPDGTNHTGIPKDEKSPYFEYIHNHVRNGLY